MKPYRGALVVSALVVGTAPFMGQIRDALKAAFPGSFVRIVGAIIAAAVLVAFVTALVRIRDRRLARYGAIAAALALSAWYIVTFSTGIPDVDAVERFHFIQYGLIGALFYGAVRTAGAAAFLLLPILCGTIVGVTDEWVQWLVPVRSGDIRDVGLNAFASSCGLLFAIGLRPPDRWRWSADQVWRRRIARLAAMAVLAFAVFVHAAHLGYEIDDPDEAVRFRSFFTREQLLAAGPARTAAWKADPPRSLKPLAIEDFYLTEGGWRVQYRNVGYGKGDFLTAWKENRILEKYYAPFLDLHSFSRPDQIHRWPDAQRAEVDSKVGDARRAPYLSEAGLDRIFIRPSKIVFWLIALAIAAGLRSASRSLHRPEPREPGAGRREPLDDDRR